MAFMSGSMDDAANMAAINDYIQRTEAKTEAAKKAKDKWIKWYDALSGYQKTFTSLETYDEARNLRNQFNEANVTSAAEKAAVQAVKQTGLSSEELRGEADRRLESGDYVERPPSEPWLPTKTKVALGVIAAVAVGLGVLKKLYVDPFLPKRL